MANRPVAGDSDRVLLVEDDAAQRVGLQQLLKSWGFAVDVAADGADALEKVADVAPDDRAERSGHAADGRARPARAR